MWSYNSFHLLLRGGRAQPLSGLRRSQWLTRGPSMSLLTLEVRVLFVTALHRSPSCPSSGREGLEWRVRRTCSRSAVRDDGTHDAVGGAPVCALCGVHSVFGHGQVACGRRAREGGVLHPRARWCYGRTWCVTFATAGRWDRACVLLLITAISVPPAGFGLCKLAASTRTRLTRLLSEGSSGLVVRDVS